MCGSSIAPPSGAFADAHADVRQPILAWFAEVARAHWSGPDDIKTRYPSARFLRGDRVVFNVKGNKYRGRRCRQVRVLRRLHPLHRYAHRVRRDRRRHQLGLVMDIKPIHTPADHAAALKEVERLWDNAQPGTSDGDKFEVLTALVDAYEREHFEIPRAHSAARRGRRRAGSRVLRSRRGKAIVGWALSTSSSRLAQSSRTIAGHFGFPHRRGAALARPRACPRAGAPAPGRWRRCTAPWSRRRTRTPRGASQRPATRSGRSKRVAGGVRGS